MANTQYLWPGPEIEFMRRILFFFAFSKMHAVYDFFRQTQHTTGVTVAENVPKALISLEVSN